MTIEQYKEKSSQKKGCTTQIDLQTWDNVVRYGARARPNPSHTPRVVRGKMLSCVLVHKILIIIKIRGENKKHKQKKQKQNKKQESKKKYKW